MSEGLVLDHFGFVAGGGGVQPAVDWLAGVLRCRVLVQEPWTSLPGRYLGVGEADEVRLCGALLDCDGGRVEVHEITPRPVDLIFHLGFRVLGDDLAGEMRRLGDRGVTWLGAPAHRITTGPYAGRQWIYGRSPAGMIELFTDPR